MATIDSSQPSIDHEIIPRPSQVAFFPGTFHLRRDTVILTDQQCEATAQYLSAVLAPVTGFSLRVLSDNPAPATHAIFLRLLPELTELGPEGYTLTIQPDQVIMQAVAPAGIFYACQTLRQLLPKEILGGALAPQVAWELPCAAVTDQPRFPWRGVMLDVARHFFTKDFILRYIDLLALYKMNRLHLHLTDGSAWTLEISKYPRLTERTEEPQSGSPARGSYSPQDIREIVAYAATRQVMIIPEIEFPSHSDAILHRYPELLCVNHPSRTGGQDHMEFCPGRDDVYQVIDDILSEIAAIFPSPYIHIGGDEYFGTAWEGCPDCRQRIEREHLEAEDSEELRQLFAHCQGSPRKYLLYRYMMRRVAQMVVAQGRIPVLWDDLSWQGNFPEQSVIMQWHYKGFLDWMQQTKTLHNPAVEAAQAGHAVVAAPASHLYFDYFDGARTLRRVYEFEPLPVELPDDQAHFILGPHACMWEYPQERIDAMLFPRLIALAEVGWTAQPLREWQQFSLRLQAHLPRLAILGVNYTPLPADTTAVVQHWQIPTLSYGMKEWFVNDIITGNGAYTVTFSFTQGKETTVVSSLFLTDDGYESPANFFHLVDRTENGDLVYQCQITDYHPDALYSVRVYLRGDGSDSSGDICVRRMQIAS